MFKEKYENFYLSREDLDELVSYIHQNCLEVNYNISSIILAINYLVRNEILYTKDDYKNITTINTELENRLYNKKVLTSE